MDATAVLLAATLPLLLYWLWWRWTHRRLLQLAAKVPGPPALPVIGNALIFMAKPEELLNIISGLLEKYGQYVKFWLGPDLNVCVKNPDDIRLLLTSNKLNQKGYLYEFLKVYIGPGVLTGGPTWRHHRKIANPSYSKRAVQHYSAVFNREAAELTELLSKKDPGTMFDVYFDVVACTTQSVCQTLMGLSKKESKDVKCMNEVVLVTQSLYNLAFTKMTHWWLQIPIAYWLSGRKKIERYYASIIDKMTSDIVQKRKRALKNNSEIDEEMLNVVDRFMFSSELDEQEIKWETFTLFTTSQEASAKIASAVLVFLAYLPEWQFKVYNEIMELLGSEDFVTDEELKKLRYLDMVYKEALRYMSIAAFIQRTVVEEVTICNGKITLPAGSSVIIPIHMVHRDPRYWEDPHKVKPERFLPDNVKDRNPNAFVPFSLGAMDCLGRVYATSLIKILVVHVLRRVEVQANGSLEDLELNVAISVKFAKGYNLRARPRSKGKLFIES